MIMDQRDQAPARAEGEREEWKDEDDKRKSGKEEKA